MDRKAPDFKGASAVVEHSIHQNVTSHSSDSKFSLKRIPLKLSMFGSLEVHLPQNQTTRVIKVQTTGARKQFIQFSHVDSNRLHWMFFFGRCRSIVYDRIGILTTAELGDTRLST